MSLMKDQKDVSKTPAKDKGGRLRVFHGRPESWLNRFLLNENMSGFECLTENSGSILILAPVQKK